MDYQSTRDASRRVSPAQAVLRGLAPDGGLFVAEPPRLALEPLAGLDAVSLAGALLGALLPGFAEMDKLTRSAYAGKFETPGLTPLVPAGGRYVLELFHGPTSAFKDIALSVLPRLITAARDALGVTEELLILTATSGDTGKAALAGFCDVPGTKIIVFYPENGVSAVQKAQMVTQAGENVRVCAVRGNFDDAQSAVKAVFAAGLPEGCGVRLSSANSINIGRLVPQTAYYFKAYFDLVRLGRIALGDPVDFSVPTGNFGDILAGFLAKRMGLPVGTLICASNRNSVLTDFLRTGIYDRNRPFYRTLSPSMDILVSSNLERLLWFMTRDEAWVASCMRALRETGRFTVPPALLGRIQADFSCASCDDAQTLETIGTVWREHGYLLDTHTAAAWHAAAQCSRPTVVLATASPFKFPEAVLAALGERAEGFGAMERLSALTGLPIPRGLAGLQTLPVLHRDVIDCKDMLNYVTGRVRQWQK